MRDILRSIPFFLAASLAALPAPCQEADSPVEDSSAEVRTTGKAVNGSLGDIPSPTQSAIAAPVVGPDAEILQRLQRAESLYEEGLGRFRSGDLQAGRSLLSQAFGLLTSTMEDETLPEDLQSDFLAMLDKVSSWQRGGERIEVPMDLHISQDELKSLPASSIPGPKRKSKKNTIPIDTENPVVRRYLQVYTEKRKDSVEQALARSGRYRAMIDAAIKKAGLPSSLFYLVMAESEYKLMAVSRAGAAGLWQFMPFTGRRYGLEVSYWVDERFDPEKATPAALRYLSDLYAYFHDWHLAMAAYNRGEGGLGRDLAFSRSVDFAGLAERNALPNETEDYVPKFMACALIGENPAAYGLKPVYEEPEPYDTIKLERDLDLAIAARCAGTTLETIQRLNPALRAWCTPKGRPDFHLRIPKGTLQTFQAELAKVENWNPGPEFVRYQVRKGDSVGRIAGRFRTSTKSILQINGLKDGRRLRVGMTLKVRPGKGYESNLKDLPPPSKTPKKTPAAKKRPAAKKKTKK